MHGAASVIGGTVRSVFPSPNSWLDEAIGILNVEFSPQNHGKKDGIKDSIYIMWSESDSRLNHFVPLLRKDSGPIVDLTDLNEFPPLRGCPMVKIPTAETDDTLLDLKFPECQEMDFSSLLSFSNSEIKNLLDLLPSCKRDRQSKLLKC